MNQYIERDIDEKVNAYFKEKQVLVITGMRRVGKTTIIKNLFSKVKSKNKLYFNLEDILIRKLFSDESYLNVKKALEGEGLDFSKKSYIFIDEIQLVPNITSVIKYLYDELDIKFVVTGSSSYYLKNHFSESLSGRKFIVELYPLTFAEFLSFKGIKKKSISSFDDKSKESNYYSSEKYSVLYKEYLDYGGFPQVVMNNSIQVKKAILRDIVNSYFLIDVTTLASFADISKMQDLLSLLTQRIGQRINITNLSNILNIPRTKVYEYIEFLKSTYVVNIIYQKTSLDNKVSSDGKLYFNDIGFASILGSISDGSRLENSVYMNLVNKFDLTYYQTSSGGEIDFVLDNKIGLEVKQKPSKQDFANLNKRAVSAKLDEVYIISSQYVDIDGNILAWDL